jgi:FkbM family methyltransferase
MDTTLCFKLNNLKLFGFNPNKILDLGAHHGIWSYNCFHIFPEAQYMLIEPIKYEELTNICNKISNFNYKNLLVYETETEVDWYEMKNTGDSIFKERTHHFSNCIPVKKQTVTLDTIFKNEKYDLIKIDCQGAEISILKGGKNLIMNTEFIILEMPFCGQYNTNVLSFSEHINFMEANNFVVFDIIGQHIYDSKLLFQIDIIFINKNSSILNKAQNIINSMGK